jgi:hypothetical protein
VFGVVFVAMGESIANSLIPLAPLPKHPSTEELTLYIRNIPFAHLLILTINYIIAGFAAGIISTFIQGRTDWKPMITAVGIIQLLTYLNFIFLPGHPAWMWLAVTFLYIPSGFTAYFLIRKKKQND